MRFFLILVSFGLAVADIQDFIQGSTKFAAAIYNELSVDNKDNILASSFSLETVLALTQSGAVGDTGVEIRSALNLPDTKEETEIQLKKVLPEISSDKYTLKTANKVYVANRLLVKEDFQKVASDVYKADFENIEFADSEPAARKINDWVKEQTENKIDEIVTPKDLDEDTRAVLVNTLYFQGNWSRPFNSANTRKTSFFLTQNQQIEVDAMNAVSVSLQISEDPDLDAKFLELPFQGSDASLVIILPNQKEGIALLEKQKKNIFAPQKFETKLVTVTLPKFKIGNLINYNPILKKLGIQKAFLAGEADFSGIAGYPGEILIDKVAQKTYIKVTEVGLEAAAATGGVIIVPGVVPPKPDVIFNADHPFAFYIQVKGVILFEGRVLRPEYD